MFSLDTGVIIRRYKNSWYGRNIITLACSISSPSYSIHLALPSFPISPLTHLLKNTPSPLTTCWKEFYSNLDVYHEMQFACSKHQPPQRTINTTADFEPLVYPLPCLAWKWDQWALCFTLRSPFPPLLHTPTFPPPLSASWLLAQFYAPFPMHSATPDSQWMNAQFCIPVCKNFPNNTDWRKCNRCKCLSVVVIIRVKNPCGIYLIINRYCPLCVLKETRKGVL